MSKIRYGIVKTQSSRAAFFCWARGYCQSVCPFFMHKFKSPSLYYKNSLYQPMHARACLKIHSRRLHAPLRGIFGPDSVSVARYASIIGTKSPTKWDAQPTESNFQTRSSTNPRYAGRNLAYCRHVEAIYCTRENVSFTIGTVCDRCNNHKGPRPDLYVLPDCPSIYHY